MALIFNYWIADAIAVVLVLITTIYVYMISQYNYWKKKKIYFLEPKLPFGNVKDMVNGKYSTGELFTEFYFALEGHKYGGIWQLHRPGLIIRDPDLIKNIMIKAFEHFSDHGFYFDEEGDPLSAHLFMLEGTRWRNLRTKLSPTFTSGKMKMMFETLQKCGEELRTYLKSLDGSKDGIEIKDLLSRYSTDIISSCAFGIQTNCLKNPDSEFRVWGRKIFKTSLYTHIRDIINFAVPALAPLFKLPSVPRDVTKYFMGVVKETIDYREQNNVSRKDFMQLLIQLKNKGFVDPDRHNASSQEKDEESDNDYTKLTFNEVAAQAFVFFVAGFETSATTMTFALYELANKLDIQKALRDEIRRVLKKYGGKVTYEAIQEMGYLEKVVSETLRLHPPVPILNRVCNKDFTIEETGDVIEKGIPIIIPVRGLQRDPKYFPDPETFNPENFSDDAIKSRPSFTYLPFGEGPRLCIGQRFGLMQVKVGLISVLRDNEITMNSKTPTPLQIDKKSFIEAPLGGMWLNVSSVN